MSKCPSWPQHGICISPAHIHKTSQLPEPPDAPKDKDQKRPTRRMLNSSPAPAAPSAPKALQSLAEAVREAALKGGKPAEEKKPAPDYLGANRAVAGR